MTRCRDANRTAPPIGEIEAFRSGAFCANHVLGLVRKLHILLVEDDPDDLEWTVGILQDEHLPHTLTIARDGEEAIQYLQSASVDANLVRPEIVLLDLHLPKQSGAEVLEALRALPELKDTPVAVLTNFPTDLEDLVKRGLRPTSQIPKPVSKHLLHHILHPLMV